MSAAILLTLITISRAQRYVNSTGKAARCNYVYTKRYTRDLSQPYAVDVCRTFVTDGVAEYRKYVCYEGVEIKDEVYDTADCMGDPVEVLNPDIAESVCHYVGSCSYIMVKEPCNNDTHYTIQPVLSNVCIEGLSPAQYFWDCTQAELDGIGSRFQFATTYNNARCFRSDFATNWNEVALHECVDYTPQNPHDPFYSMESQCLNIYYGPTSEPTMDPTSDPTLEPTYIPSDEPTVNPTTAEPTATPTASPTELGDGVSHVAVVVGIIFVNLMVMFT